MDYLFFRSASALAIRGAVAIALGVVALLLPGPAFVALTIAFGIFALIDGVSALIALFDKRSRFHRGWLAVEAVAGILAGALVLLWPGIAAINLIWVIGVWAIVTGIMKIVSAIRLRKEIEREWLLVLSGVASIVFGGILVWAPLPGVIGLMWVIGIYGLVVGGMQLALAIKMHRFDDRLEQPPMSKAA